MVQFVEKAGIMTVKRKSKRYTRGLDELDVGEAAKVVSISECECKRRLYDLGFRSGEKVICEASSPLRDPSAYCVRGTTFALRRTLAKKIKVTR